MDAGNRPEYDIDLINQSYFDCQGEILHMARENSEVYELYKRLDPDKELLESLFAKLWEDPAFVWGRHSQIVIVLNRGRVDTNYWVSRLLDEMEKMDELDKRSKIIIIETMSGRNRREDEGGVHLIGTHTDLGSRMITVMDRLTDFYCDESDNLNKIGWDNIVNRYLVAVNSYEKACRKYIL